MESTTVATPTSTTTSAPASTASAAPATSAPAETSAPVQRPTTFAEAFAREDAAPPVSDPATPTETAATAPAAGQDPESATGPIPFTVHKTALENARTKERERLQQEFDTQYGWAKSVDRQAAEAGAQIGRLYNSDKPGFIRQVLSEAMADPEMAPLIRSEAARALGSRPQQQAAQQAQTLPDIPILDGQGQVVGNLRDIVQAHLQQFAQTELQPLRQDLESRKQQADAQRAAAQLQQSINDIYSEAVDVLPGFKEHEAEIAKVFNAMATGDPARNLRAAWKQVVGSTLANRDQVTADHLKTLQTKAAASGVNPASAAMPATKRPTSFHDASLQW